MASLRYLSISCVFAVHFLQLASSTPLHAPFHQTQAPVPVPGPAADVQPLLTVVSAVGTSVQDLDFALNDIHPGAGMTALTMLVQKAQAVRMALAAATSQVNAVTGRLVDADAARLAAQTDVLVTQTHATISVLLDKQPELAALGATGTTVIILQNTKSAASGLATALDLKVPKSRDAQKTAAQSIHEVAGAFDTAIAAFSSGPPPPPAETAGKAKPWWKVNERDEDGEACEDSDE